MAFVLFWILLLLCRHELGLKWILILIGFWVGALAGMVWGENVWPGVGPSLFMSLQGIVDVVLVVVILKGDIRIW
ncbi:MAG: hypothetical protein IMZ66_05650 [Planctomycetes bacterium]|nr:hypothetical protein [Planctomycetota bacterium]